VDKFVYFWYSIKISEGRRCYSLDKVITVNDLLINEIVFDSHVDKHSDHISDEVILSLVKLLDGKNYIPTSIKEDFSYFVSNITKDSYTYRLVWLQQKHCLYIGVITAFRDKGLKS
jgi:hypothetical protein